MEQEASVLTHEIFTFVGDILQHIRPHDHDDHHYDSRLS